MSHTSMLTVTYTASTTTIHPSRLRVVHDTRHGKVAWWVPVDYRLNNEEQCRAIAQTLAEKWGGTVLAGFESVSNRRPLCLARTTWTFFLAKGLPMC